MVQIVLWGKMTPNVPQKSFTSFPVAFDNGLWILMSSQVEHVQKCFQVCKKLCLQYIIYYTLKNKHLPCSMNSFFTEKYAMQDINCDQPGATTNGNILKCIILDAFFLCAFFVLFLKVMSSISCPPICQLSHFIFVRQMLFFRAAL